jgi:hypothetical protein
MLNFLEFPRVYTLLALSKLYLKTALRHHCHLPLQRCPAAAKRTEDCPGVNRTLPRLTKPSDCENDCSTNMSECQEKPYVLYDAMGGTYQRMAAVLPCRLWCCTALGRHQGSEEPSISLAWIMSSSTSYCSRIS